MIRIDFAGFAVRCGLTAALLVRSAAAQVNIEPLRSELPPEGFGGRLNGTLTAYEGNTRGLVMGSSFFVGLREARHQSFLTGAADFARLGGTTQVAKSFGHARYVYALPGPISMEAFGQAEADRFRDLRLRELLGAGPRFESGAELYDIAYGSAYMLEYMVRNAADAPGGALRQINHRWSQYARGSIRAGERVLLANTFYYQPRFDDFSDYRLLNMATLEFKVTELVRSRIDATLRYESVTPERVKPHDIEVKNSISLKF